MELLETNKGYKIPSKVKLVRSEWKYQKYDEKQAFVVDADSDSQLETAINWAGGRYDEEKKKSISDNIIETDNDGFEIEFMESAGGSSQGGKLSFWDCKVTKDGQSYIIGINQDLLLELIKSATIVKGKVQEKCLFVKQRGNTGLIIKDSDIYKECMKEIETKKNLQNLKKTTSWEKGIFYNTPTGSSDVYIADVYQWYESEDTGWCRSKIVRLEKPIKNKFMIDDWYFKNTNLLSEVISNSKWFFESIYNNMKKSLPSRFKTDKSISIDLTDKELEKMKLKYLDDVFNKSRVTNRGKAVLTSILVKSSLITFTPEPPILIDEIKNETEFEMY